MRVAEYHTYFVGHQTWGFAVWSHNMSVAYPGGGGGPVNRNKVTTPNAAAKAKSQGRYIDPLTNKLVQTTENLAADHIYPKARIKKLRGYRDLTPAQQSEVLNNLENFRGMPQSLNASKGSKIDWTKYKGEPLDPQYAQQLAELQQLIEQELQAQIDTFLKGRK